MEYIESNSLKLDNEYFNSIIKLYILSKKSNFDEENNTLFEKELDNYIFQKYLSANKSIKKRNKSLYTYNKFINLVNNFNWCYTTLQYEKNLKVRKTIHPNINNSSESHKFEHTLSPLSSTSRTIPKRIYFEIPKSIIKDLDNCILYYDSYLFQALNSSSALHLINFELITTKNFTCFKDSNTLKYVYVIGTYKIFSEIDQEHLNEIKRLGGLLGMTIIYRSDTN